MSDRTLDEIAEKLRRYSRFGETPDRAKIMRDAATLLEKQQREIKLLRKGVVDAMVERR